VLEISRFLLQEQLQRQPAEGTGCYIQAIQLHLPHLQHLPLAGWSARCF
jgi:hypothetical protein